MRTETQKTQGSTKAKPVSSQRSSTPQYSHPVLKLQQQIGNQAVQHLFQSRYIQAKLTIGQPDDIYVQEADRVAYQIMRTPPLPVSGCKLWSFPIPWGKRNITLRPMCDCFKTVF